MNIRKKNSMFILMILIFLPFITHAQSFNYQQDIMMDSEFKTTVYVYDSNMPGETLLIIGGVHGDETAGIKAAEKMIGYKPNKGKIVLIPKANIAACNSNSRTEYYMEDLNRSFIGCEFGNSTQVLAWEITKVIEKHQPVMVIDLHESEGLYKENTDLIGQSIIISSGQSNDPIEIAFIVLDSMGFTVLSGAPEGSLNMEISRILGIPVITIETDGSQELGKRVSQHLDIIEIIMKYYGMEGQACE